MISPEISENSESLNTKQKLIELKLYIWKDYKKFENLSKDSRLKNWINKIFNKSFQLAFPEECKHFEKINIWWTIQKILKKYPNIRQEIIWDLWLSLQEVKFSKLSNKQKINFLSLYQSVSTKDWKFKSDISPNNIISDVNNNNINNLEEINKQFKYLNIKNLLLLKKTLQDDFWLSSEEYEKVKEYLEIIKKHPEYTWKTRVLQVSSPVSYLSISIIKFLLWSIWRYYFDDIWKPNL